MKTKPRSKSLLLALATLVVIAARAVSAEPAPLQKKGSGPISRNGPQGASQKLDLPPFSAPDDPLVAGFLDPPKEARPSAYWLWLNGYVNRDYAELLTLIGKAVATTQKGDQVLALKRFSWFSIEFGLIEEGADTKVFGAGILSSTGEIPYSLLSPEVTREPFLTDVVITTDYDPSRMQDHLFIAPSLPFLRRELENLVRRFAIPVL